MTSNRELYNKLQEAKRKKSKQEEQYERDAAAGDDWARRMVIMAKKVDHYKGEQIQCQKNINK